MSFCWSAVVVVVPDGAFSCQLRRVCMSVLLSICLVKSFHRSPALSGLNMPVTSDFFFLGPRDLSTGLNQRSLCFTLLADEFLVSTLPHGVVSLGRPPGSVMSVGTWEQCGAVQITSM